MSGKCPIHYYLQHTHNENNTSNFFCQCSASHQPVGQWSTIIPLVSTTKNRWRCHICTESFTRRQERDRHELTHVPYFMHCPLSHCTWRGNRASSFKKHWQRADHRNYHEHYGHTPERSQIQTFDPWLILNQIINGAISLREGEVQAIGLVQVKASQLQKPSMWKDPWGRNKRHVLGRAQVQGQAQAQ